MRKAFSMITLTSLTAVILFIASCEQRPKRVLIFSKINEIDGFRHESIEKGVEVLTQLGNELGYDVVHSEDASMINEDSLKNFHAVVFLNPSHDILDQYQQADFERFIQAGGGFIGIHGATTAEYDWAWYGKLVGAYFVDHPEIQKATIRVVDKEHPVSDSIPEIWERTDEWYNFRDIADDIHVIMELDESSYHGGKNGDSHPIVWYHDFDGGKALYTGFGHTIESYDEPLLRKHFKSVLEFIVEGIDNLDYSKASSLRPPDENGHAKIIKGSIQHVPLKWGMCQVMIF